MQQLPKPIHFKLLHFPQQFAKLVHDHNMDNKTSANAGVKWSTPCMMHLIHTTIQHETLNIHTY